MKRIAMGLSMAGILLGGCVSDAGPPATPDRSAVEAPATSSTSTTPVAEGVWNTAPEVLPEGVGAPVAEGGTLFNSLEAPERVVVSLSYPGDRRREIAAMYADWAVQVGGADHEQGTMTVRDEALWFERWSVAGVEVRMVDCIDPREGDFTLTCVAITTARSAG